MLKENFRKHIKRWSFYIRSELFYIDLRAFYIKSRIFDIKFEEFDAKSRIFDIRPKVFDVINNTFEAVSATFSVKYDSFDAISAIYDIEQETYTEWISRRSLYLSSSTFRKFYSYYPREKIRAVSGSLSPITSMVLSYRIYICTRRVLEYL